MTLKEYSGHPPPRMSSSFGTPDGNRWMGTLLCGSLMVTFDPRWRDGCGFPRRLHEGHDEIFTDERAEQSYLVGQHSGEALLKRRAIHCPADAAQSFERAPLAVLGDNSAEPGELCRCHMHRAGEQGRNGGWPE